LSITDQLNLDEGHLHLDHAGGLENFKGTDVPIWCHEKEIKHAFFSIAVKTDIGAYHPGHIDYGVNWKAWYGPFLEIAPGINLRHSPGHTPGLVIMQVNLQDSGTFIFTSESVYHVVSLEHGCADGPSSQYHVKENYENDEPQGWLARDHDDWCASHQMIKSLAKVSGCSIHAMQKLTIMSSGPMQT
jgi:glyoxylase-like metal-dependent hydrolase (beta-lactamase superfamily II)